MLSPAPRRSGSKQLWVQFFLGEEEAAATGDESVLVERYVVDAVNIVRGDPPEELDGLRRMTRVQRREAPLPRQCPFTGTTQHLTYTSAAHRNELAGASRTEPGERAVLIPIVKSEAWWSLASDERLALFHGSASAPGHREIGLGYAGRIFRTLYHCRYLPGSRWDFLTYFEFADEQTNAFVSLLSKLRNPDLNPEWEYVVREVEIWMTKSANESPHR